MNSPLFSVITINYNNAAGLEKTLNSLRQQRLKEIDFIVIDGGSTDRSKELMESNRDIITYQCSEKDNGIYHAQNKGISVAKGKFLVFMNSGDCFNDPSVLEKCKSYLAQKPGHKIFYGNTLLIEKDGTARFLAPPAKLDLHFFYLGTLNHQSALIDRQLFAEYGLYNENHKLASDYEFFFKVFLKEPTTFQHIDLVICNYENFGMSANVASFERVVKERKQIQAELLNTGQLKDLERLEIKLLGRSSKYFGWLPPSERIRRLYDRFYLKYYQLRKH